MDTAKVEPPKKKRRVIPKLQIVESHSKPEGEDEPLHSLSSLLPNSADAEQFKGDQPKPKKQLESHMDGSIQSMTSVSTIPIMKSQINIER